MHLLSKIPFYYWLAILLSLTSVVFYPSLNCGFTNWDDTHLILENTLIRSLDWENLKLMFSDFYVANYQPLTLVSWAIDYQLFELDPFGFHLVNVILHLLNVLLVFFFIRRLSPGLFIPLLTAALFALHPMRVESITWATERKDVLYGFFFLLSLLAYLKYMLQTTAIERPDKSKIRIYYLAALIFFLLSCLTKTMAVTLSLVIILLDFLFERKLSRVAVLDKLPFFIIALILGLISFAGHDRLVDIFSDFDLFDRIQYAGFAFIFYFEKFLLPINLSAFYPYPFVGAELPLYFWIYPVLTMAIIALAVISLKRTRKILFGLGFFSVSIVLVLQIAPINESIAADHYSYLAYIGLFYLAAVFLQWCEGKLSRPAMKWTLRSVILAVIIVLSILTHDRIAVWQDSLSLWNDVISKHPNVALAYHNRGSLLWEMGKYEQAILEYNRVLKLDPSSAKGYNNRGNVKLDMKRYRAAILDYNNAIQLVASYSKAYSNRGIARYNLEEYENAFSDFNKAIELNPENAQGYYNRGNAYYKSGKFAEAIIDFSRAIKTDVRFSKAYYSMGNALFYSGRSNEACENWSIALGLGYEPADRFLKLHCRDGQTNEMKRQVQKEYANGQIKLDIEYTLQGPDTIAWLVNYDSLGNVMERGVIIDGKYDGRVIWYYTSGKTKIRGFYKDTVAYGNWEEYYDGDGIRAEYSYTEGKMNGVYKYYHENGQLWTERVYKDGLLLEILSNYDSKGNSLNAGTMKDGSGTVIVYDELGDEIDTVIYQNGIPTTEGK